MKKEVITIQGALKGTALLQLVAKDATEELRNFMLDFEPKLTEYVNSYIAASPEPAKARFYSILTIFIGGLAALEKVFTPQEIVILTAALSQGGQERARGEEELMKALAEMPMGKGMVQ